MSIVSKKNHVQKVVHTRKIKPLPETKNIGLDEQIAEARRVYRSLENPELLWAHMPTRQTSGK
jgi:hypothetical protein